MNVRESLTNLLFTVGSIPLGSDFIDSLNEMQRVQWSTWEELQSRNEQRLHLLLTHAAENVPYYRNLFRRRGIDPVGLRTIDDLRVFPVLSKSDYRALEAVEFCATNIKPGFHVKRTTSGSTGAPFEFSLDRRALPIVFASHLFYDSWYGLKPFDRYVRIVAPAQAPDPIPPDAPVPVKLRWGITSRLQSLYEGWTQEKISFWDLNSAEAEKVWRCINRFRPEFVMGYTSTLAAIASELLRRNRRLVRPIRGVITIAETLTPDRKSLIEQYFGAPVINRYGLREFGSWSAQSCHVSPDRFHVNTELVVFEILRSDGTACAAGETGHIVMTDLHNYARPFIRYDTGDLAVASQETCACGRGFPLLGPIEGRSLECLRTPSGREISPAILGHFLFVYHNHFEVVRHYQLIKQTPEDVSLLIVPGNGWNEDRRELLRSDLRRLLGDEMDVEVQMVSEIPMEKSGKRLIIKEAQKNFPGNGPKR